mgnify:FL=1
MVGQKGEGGWPNCVACSLRSSWYRSTYLRTYARRKAASIEVGGENWSREGQASSRGPRVLDRRTSLTSVLVAKEYSMAGLQHVRQQLLP